MKTIDEYLSTKVKFNKIDFPDKNHKNEIREFLVNNGFKDLGLSPDTLIEIDDMFNKELSKCFMIGDHDPHRKYSFWIRFKNHGKISKQNPVFFVRTNELTDCDETSAENYKKYKTYEEFRNRVINFFDW